jgi:hypothetical protein
VIGLGAPVFNGDEVMGASRSAARPRLALLNGDMLIELLVSTAGRIGGGANLTRRPRTGPACAHLTIYERNRPWFVLHRVAGRARHAVRQPSELARKAHPGGIPFAAGGVGDASFRLIAPAIEARIGQRFVIEARPGAGGNIAAQEVARAANDGYTLLMPSTSVLSVNPYLFSNLGFDPIGRLIRSRPTANQRR